MLDPRGVPQDVRDVCRRLHAAGCEAFLVGGGVRDALLGREPGDFDIATDAPPGQVMELFGERFAIPTGLKHGTVTVVTPEGRNVEVTTYRGEGAYLDGRHPSSVTFVSSLPEDLARRDFTMNAIAYDPEHDRMVDPFGGQTDIAARLVRAVGDPLARFREDGLRVMRAVRQATQLGFEVEPATLDAIPAARDVFRKVSIERMRDELLKLLAAPKPSRGIEMMRITGLLEDVLPELLESVGVAQNHFHRHDVYGHTLETLDGTSGDALTRLAALLHDIGKPRTRQPKPEAPGENSFFQHEVVSAEMADAISRRMKLPTADRERITHLVKHHMFWYEPSWSDGSVRRFLRRVGLENLPSLMALRRGDIVGRGFGEDPDKETAALEARVASVMAQDAALKVTDLAIDGKDVMRLLQIPPGLAVGRILDALLEKVLDDPAMNTREKLEPLVVELSPQIIQHGSHR